MGGVIFGGLAFPLASWLVVELAPSLWDRFGPVAIPFLAVNYGLLVIRTVQTVSLAIEYGKGRPVRGAALAWQTISLAGLIALFGLQVALWGA
jgi:hypothetical protein